MNESLVVHLRRSAEASVSWVAVDGTGALAGAVVQGSLADAAAAAAGRPVTVLLPATAVLRTRADVPVRNGVKLLQAVPFALEEQLADDVEDLHFAAGKRDAAGQVPVAVVRREDLDAWCARLADHGVKAQRLYSEADAVAVIPNTATLLVQDEHAILAAPDGALAAVDLAGCPALLQLWLDAGSADRESGSEGRHLVVYGAPERMQALGPALDQLRTRLDSLEVHALADGPLPRMAAHIVTAPGIDLLQGDYAQRSSLMSFWPAWRMAAVLLLALGGVAVGAQLLELRQRKVELQGLDAAIDKAFHYVFPDAGPVTDARGQLSGRLQQLGSQGGGKSHEFLDTLRVVAQSLQTNGATRIEALSYRAGTLELRVRAPSVESLDKIQQLVGQGGTLKAQIQSANAAGNEVVGRLQVTRAGN